MEHTWSKRLITISLIIILNLGSMPFVIDLGSEFSNVKAAETIIVDHGGAGDYTTIQDAINNASLGDTIQVRSGTYNENILIIYSLNLIGAGMDKTIINFDGSSSIVSIWASWVKISGFTIKKQDSSYEDNEEVAVFLWGNNCTLKNNNISNNFYGISLNLGTKNNYISNNIFWDCKIGVYLEEKSMENLVANNTFVNNINGIQIYKSRDNIVEHNVFSKNGKGIYFEDSPSNLIKYNDFTDNYYGIYIDNSHCKNNTFRNNNIIRNTYGYYSRWTEGDIFFKNNFIENINQVHWESYSDYDLWNFNDDIWNNEQNEGNFWSDYQGLDNGALGRSAGDGIGDTRLPHRDIDCYPLMVPTNGLKYNVIRDYDEYYNFSEFQEFILKELRDYDPSKLFRLYFKDIDRIEMNLLFSFSIRTFTIFIKMLDADFDGYISDEERWYLDELTHDDLKNAFEWFFTIKLDDSEGIISSVSCLKNKDNIYNFDPMTFRWNISFPKIDKKKEQHRIEIIFMNISMRLFMKLPKNSEFIKIGGLNQKRINGTKVSGYTPRYQGYKGFSVIFKTELDEDEGFLDIVANNLIAIEIGFVILIVIIFLLIKKRGKGNKKSSEKLPVFKPLDQSDEVNLQQYTEVEILEHAEPKQTQKLKLKKGL